MEFHQLLVLSLAHASPSARAWLSESATANHARIFHDIGEGAAISSVAAAAFGYFTRVPEDPETLGVCEDLLPVMSFARAHGAAYLLLDGDACATAELPTWDDDGDFIPAEAETQELAIGRVVEAARAVVAQWDNPSWSLTEPTAKIVNTLRGAIADYDGGQASAAESTVSSWQATAQVEGWALVAGPEDGLLLETIDKEKFRTDADAWKHVWKKSRAGSAPHKDALNHLQEKNYAEYADIVAYCSE